MKWYKLGKIKSGTDPDKVIGQDTNWAFAGIKPGDAFLLEGYQPLEIISVEDNTNLTLEDNVYVTSWTKYKIIPVVSATMQATVYSDLSELLWQLRQLFDAKTNTLRGQSAYELAQSQGFTGTLTDWLESLKGGPKGDPGNNGKSSYEIALENGFRGTVNEWLATLKGETGKNNYELAKEAGFTGTLNEYLASLHGKDGVDGEDGLSTYQIAVANGFIGTQLAWLESLRADYRHCKYYHHGHFILPPDEGETPPDGAECTPPPPKPSRGITNNIYVGEGAVSVEGGTKPSSGSGSVTVLDGGDMDAGTSSGSGSSSSDSSSGTSGGTSETSSSSSSMDGGDLDNKD